MSYDSSAIPSGVVQHAQLEFETLDHVKSALGNAIAADFGQADLGRKLANVRFVLGSFQRYVERLFAVEEHDGYMSALAETHPHLQLKIDDLRADHHEIRELIRAFVVRLESLTGADVKDFSQLCSDVAKLIRQVEKHTHAETLLLQESYNWDFGGEA